jgi:hypothetical protein
VVPRYGRLSYRDVEELLVERGVEVDQVTVYRWVRRFSPAADASRSSRHSPSVYRAMDQHGQVIDVLVPTGHDANPARRFFQRPLTMMVNRARMEEVNAAHVKVGVIAPSPFAVAAAKEAFGWVSAAPQRRSAAVPQRRNVASSGI